VCGSLADDSLVVEVRVSVVSVLVPEYAHALDGRIEFQCLLES
jgi:hypothetical protein